MVVGKTEYKVNVSFYGMPAYVIDKLLEQGLHGTTKSGVVERIVSEWMLEHVYDLEFFGINIQDAKEQKYIPIKLRKEKR